MSQTVSYADWLWWRSCGRKVAYNTPTKAVRGLSAAQRLHPDEHFVIYQCRFCGEWHVGKPQPKQT